MPDSSKVEPLGERLPLYVHTIGRLNARQLIYQPLRRIQFACDKRFGRSLESKLADHAEQHAVLERVNFSGVEALNTAWFHALAQSEEFEAVLLEQAEQILEGHWQFLQRNVAQQEHCWRYPGETVLWNYNLNYFEWLLPLMLYAEREDRRAAISFVERTLESWIEHNQLGRDVGYMPYPTSLRIVMWLRALAYFRKDFCSDVVESALKSLVVQCHYLRLRTEEHLQANHLLENARALYFGATVLGLDDLRRVGQALLHRECRAQFNSDGGHCERSLAYHAGILERLKDISFVATDATRSLLDETVQRGGQFLGRYVTPDKRVVLFNDAASDMYSPLTFLQRYLDGTKGLKQQGLSFDQDSAFIVVDQDRLWFAIDLGAPAPRHQPGHAHNGLSSYELFVDGLPVVVDSGTYCYYLAKEPRRYDRSTAAHNVLQLEGAEQSELWATFRVARGTRVESRAHRVLDNNGYEIYLRYRGFPSLGWRECQRKVVLYPDYGTIFVSDRVLGGDERSSGATKLHLHPRWRVIESDSSVVVLDDSLDTEKQLFVAGAGGVSKERSYHSPSFGVREDNTCLSWPMAAHDTNASYYLLSTSIKSVESVVSSKLSAAGNQIRFRLCSQKGEEIEDIEVVHAV